MNQLPLITIIVPIYNGEHYLSQCIDSILQQNYKNIEIILVDDGSTDNSAKIADGYAIQDSRVKVIHQKNAGVSAARNAALDCCSGEYVCFIDCDDYIAQDYISYFYNLLLENHAEIALTPTAKKVTALMTQEEECLDKVEVWTGKKAAAEMLYYNLIIASWNKMISRNLIEKNNLRFNPNLPGGEGFTFSVDCFQRAEKVAVGRRKVYYYRVDNPNSAMTKFNMKVLDSSIKAQKMIALNLVEKTPDLLQACRYANWHTYCDILNTMVGCQVLKQYPQKFNEIKKVCQKEALCVLNAPVPIKEKLKGILYFINPYLAACLINHFRLRKFTKNL